MGLFAPQLMARLVKDGFRIPVPAGTTFTAGDIVVVPSTGTALLLGLAPQDWNWQGSTSSVNSLDLIGLVAVPKLTTESIPAGVKIGWNVAPYAGSTGFSVATAVATSAGTTVTQVPMGISVLAATTANTLTTDNGQAAVLVLMWPGSGLGS